MYISKIFNYIKKNKYLVLNLLILVISISALILSVLIILKLNINLLNLDNKKHLENVNQLDNFSKLDDIEKKNSELIEELNKLKEKNNEIIENAEACKLFAYNYFLFFEKANELFANGTTGCAVRYIQSGDSTKFPTGCFRFDVGKGTNQWGQRNWYQNPDKNYYDSLSNYYYQYLKYQNQCIKNL
jgi:hypothetical protein